VGIGLGSVIIISDAAATAVAVVDDAIGSCTPVEF
jgi:hypothetical protein